METTKNVFRTRVEALYLSEMVADDRDMVMVGEADSAALDNIIPVNTVGLFDDTTSSDDDYLSDLLGDDDYDDDYLFD